MAGSDHSGLTLFGGFGLERRGVSRVVGARASRLLAFLAVRGRTPRPVVAGALWPESSDAHASGSLRTSLWRLNRVGIPVAERGSRHLALPADVDVDLTGFVQWLSRLKSGAPLEESDLDAERIPSTDLLPGWSDTWVVAERERLHHLRLHALDLLALELARRSRWAQAADTAAAAIRTDPLRESPVRILVDIHLRRGEVTEARRRVESFRRLLHDELGMVPSPRLTSMVDVGRRLTARVAP